jgi:hypothetical protein
VALEAQTEGRARAIERVTASFHGDETAIAFNPHYLLDGITAAAGGPARHPAPPAGADGGAAGGSAADGPADGTVAARDGSAEPATIRLEFTSPARPALITLAGDDRDEGGPGAGTDGDDDAEKGPRPAFRYLVVPLRSPARA